MAPLTPFATVAYLESIWRNLDGPEEVRASALLAQASNNLRLVSKNNGVDIDQKILDDASGLYAEAVKGVIAEVVKRAMVKPIDAPPADQWSQAASPYSESMTFTNPSSDLFFKRSELDMLGFGGISGRSQFGVLKGVTGSIDEC